MNNPFPFESCAPFVPHAHAEIMHGTMPSEIPLAAYQQWCSRLDTLTTKDIDAQRITYKSDGLNVTGVMITPKIIPEEGLPLLIFNRGGSGKYGMITVLQILYLLAPLASMGYIVLASNYRGNDGGEGAEEFGGADVHDVINLLELGKLLPTWNNKHCFMAGWSRGGMMTLLADKLGAKLDAIATVAGMTDCISTMHDHPDMRELYARRVPFANEHELNDQLKERSAVYWADRIHAPLLIQHGDADERIHLDQAERLTHLLKQRGHPHCTIIYAGGNHFLNAQRADLLREIDNWFRYYRKD
jgi:dipeptidyl aminopeptidase/acylaminoacyl peptidase